MNAPVAALVLSFFIAFFFIPVIIRIATAKRLFDEPDVRKVHTKPISALGGVGIFGGFIFSLLFTIPFAKAAAFQHYTTAGLVIFFLGLKDDIMVMKPLRKLAGQVMAAAVLVHLAGLQIDSMHGFFGISDLPSWFGSAVTYFVIVLIINAVNLIDGIDGLAGMLGLSTSLLLGTYFLYCGQYFDASLSFALAGSLAAFLVFNMQPARIFMGDGGSMLIGMVVSVLVIRFINYAPHSTVMPIMASPAVGFSFVVIPLMDTLRVFTIRMLNGRSPFSPDKNHIHHLLLRRQWTHRRIAFVLASVNSGFIALAFAMASLDVNLLFLIIGSIFFFLMGLITRSRRIVQPKNLAQDSSNVPVPQGRPSVISANGGVVAENN